MFHASPVSKSSFAGDCLHTAQFIIHLFAQTLERLLSHDRSADMDVQFRSSDHDAGKSQQRQRGKNLSAASFVPTMMSAVTFPLCGSPAPSETSLTPSCPPPLSLLPSSRQTVWEAPPAGPALHHVPEVLAEDGAHGKLRHPHDVPR